MRNRLSKSKINFIFIFLLFTGLLLSACNYSNKLADPPAKTNDQVFNELALDNNYESVNIKVITPECLRCHSSVGGNQGGLNLETYDSIKQHLNQIIYRVVELQDMPRNGLKANDYNLIKLWLESGAPEKNTQSGELKPLLGPFNWENIKSDILQKNCLDCHQGITAEAKLDLSDYDQFRNNLTAIFDSMFVKQSMPPKPYDSLNVNEKQALLKWISTGMPK